MSLRRPHYLLVIACLGLAACGDGETSVPQPVPVPRPSYIRESSPQGQQTATLVVGLPKAVDGVGQVEIVDRSNDARITAPTTVAGSFSLLVSTSKDSALEIRFLRDGGASAFVPFSARQGSLGPRLDAVNYSDSPVTTTDGQGEVVVSHKNGKGEVLIKASPDMDIVVSNTITGAVVTGQTNATGGFELRLKASVGDLISIALFDDSMGPPMSSNYLTYEVPAS